MFDAHFDLSNNVRFKALGCEEDVCSSHDHLRFTPTGFLALHMFNLLPNVSDFHWRNEIKGAYHKNVKNILKIKRKRKHDKVYNAVIICIAWF